MPFNQNQRTMSSAAWRLEKSTARLKVSAWEAVVDLTRPNGGMHDWRFKGSELVLPKFVLGVELDSVTLEDVYLRGTDLVATYSATPTRPTRVQIYWRVHTDASRTGTEVLAIDLQVSVQTHLLDSNPALVTSSLLQADEICREVRPACLLARRTRESLSYAEMVHPEDQRRDAVAIESTDKSSPKNAQQFKLTHELFLPPLEKGVILRGRIRGVFMPCEGDEATTQASYSEFIAAEPPLTT
jgi:hypothetical protein